jgi:uncharacterized membrane protein YozB (DUF420 family)
LGDSDAVLAGSVPPRREIFPPVHRADALFVPAVVAYIWAGLLFGFVPRLATHIAQHKVYSTIAIVHSIVFSAWMALLTTQLVLVRSGNVTLHRRLGHAGVLLAPVLVIVGLMVSVHLHHVRFGTPRWDPQFLSIQLADLVNFSVLVGFALALRGDGASHRRLMLLAVTALSNAGFSRWWSASLGHLLGEGFVSELAQDYLGDFTIVAAMLAYDLLTRGRVNRSLAWGASLLVGVEVLAVALYSTPAWIAFSSWLLRP